MRILKDHLTETHGLRDIIFRCRLCRTTFERVHRLECHAPRCKTGKGSPSETLHPEKCETCTRRFPTKSGKSQHERHRHPETANQRRINAAKLEAQRKRDKRHAPKELEKLEAERRRTKFYEANEAPILKTEWDAAASRDSLNHLPTDGQHKRAPRYSENGPTSRGIRHLTQTHL